MGRGPAGPPGQRPAGSGVPAAPGARRRLDPHPGAGLPAGGAGPRIRRRGLHRARRSGQHRRADGRAADAAELLDQALGLWRGSAYAEFADEEFARAEAARLEELRTTAEEDRVDVELALGHAGGRGRPGGGAGGGAPAAGAPARAAHARAVPGRPAGRRVGGLPRVPGPPRRRAGADPSAELRGLQNRILRQDLALAAAPTADPAARSGPDPARRAAAAGHRPHRTRRGTWPSSRRSCGAPGWSRSSASAGSARPCWRCTPRPASATEHPDGAGLVELAAARDPDRRSRRREHRARRPATGGPRRRRTPPGVPAPQAAAARARQLRARRRRRRAARRGARRGLPGRRRARHQPGAAGGDR